MYAYILDNFNAGTPNYHHCLLSSNLLSVLKGREECSIIGLHMNTYWIILILTLISTLNIPICKFKYQRYDHYTNQHLFDHYADQHLFDHCSDHHLADHHANIIQLSHLSSCKIQLFTCISIHTN